jgi:hypothetical protein
MCVCPQIDPQDPYVASFDDLVFDIVCRTPRLETYIPRASAIRGTMDGRPLLSVDHVVGFLKSSLRVLYVYVQARNAAGGAYSCPSLDEVVLQLFRGTLPPTHRFFAATDVVTESLVVASVASAMASPAPADVSRETPHVTALRIALFGPSSGEVALDVATETGNACLWFMRQLMAGHGLEVGAGCECVTWCVCV